MHIVRYNYYTSMEIICLFSYELWWEKDVFTTYDQTTSQTIFDCIWHGTSSVHSATPTVFQDSVIIS
jgi:hypothetical protein